MDPIRDEGNSRAWHMENLEILSDAKAEVYARLYLAQVVKLQTNDDYLHCVAGSVHHRALGRGDVFLARLAEITRSRYNFGPSFTEVKVLSARYETLKMAVVQSQVFTDSLRPQRKSAITMLQTGLYDYQQYYRPYSRLWKYEPERVTVPLKVREAIPESCHQGTSTSLFGETYHETIDIDHGLGSGSGYSLLELAASKGDVELVQELLRSLERRVRFEHENGVRGRGRNNRGMMPGEEGLCRVCEVRDAPVCDGLLCDHFLAEIQEWIGDSQASILATKKNWLSDVTMAWPREAICAVKNLALAEKCTPEEILCPTPPWQNFEKVRELFTEAANLDVSVPVRVETVRPHSQ